MAADNDALDGLHKPRLPYITGDLAWAPDRQKILWLLAQGGPVRHTPPGPEALHPSGNAKIATNHVLPSEGVPHLRRSTGRYEIA